MNRDWLESAKLPAETDEFRREVRTFLDRQLASYPLECRAYSWMRADVAFSRAMGLAGLIGVTWPARYGGRERSALDRYVLAEELLAAGAPIGAHWTADRQVGPTLLRFGTQAQRDQFLPGIAAGNVFFCVGLSEPDVGSDAASVRCAARPVEGGWLVSGTKLWITQAHICHFMLALVRTDPSSQRHSGLSQLIIDLAAPGVTVRPIRDLMGEEHYCEVIFDDVFVPTEMLVGSQGGAWQQIVVELSNERSGPERYLSSFPLLDFALDLIRNKNVPGADEQVGRIAADLLALRAMSIGVAHSIHAGQDPSVLAALVKSAGSTFEQAVPDLVRRLTRVEPWPNGSQIERALAVLTGINPVFSLRGGTREILEYIIARSLVRKPL